MPSPPRRERFRVRRPDLPRTDLRSDSSASSNPTGAKLLDSTFIGGRYSGTVASVSAIVVDDAGAIHLLGSEPKGTKETSRSRPMRPIAAARASSRFYPLLTRIPSIRRRCLLSLLKGLLH